VNRFNVIGHPEGLKYTLSTDRFAHGDSTIQISAPISPGNSGGPVYDNRNLLAVSASHVQELPANAEI